MSPPFTVFSRREGKRPLSYSCADPAASPTVEENMTRSCIAVALLIVPAPPAAQETFAPLDAGLQVGEKIDVLLDGPCAVHGDRDTDGRYEWWWNQSEGELLRSGASSGQRRML
jgi:hypothetical protein